MKLALEGGVPVRCDPFPPRRLFGSEERDAARELFDRTIESGLAFRYGGEEQTAYEAEFARFHGGGHATLVNSGTSALYAALTALELAVPGEVIVPAVTDAGGLMPVVLRNLVPVVADTSAGSFAIGAAQVEPLLSPWTRAIVVAHIAGEPADAASLAELARIRGIPLIEDCSQAHGATWRGKIAGSFGDVAVFSTMSGKHHATGGQGGVVFTRRAELADPIRRAVDRGKPFGLEEQSNVSASLNFNGSDLSGAIGRAQLRKLPEIVQRRRSLVRRLASELAHLTAVHIGWRGSLDDPSWWFLRLQLDLSRISASPAWFVEALRAEGIPVGTWADTPYRHRWFRERNVFPGGHLPWTLPDYGGAHRSARFECPNAEAAIDAHCALFIHERWTDAEVRDVRLALEKVEHAAIR